MELRAHALLIYQPGNPNVVGQVFVSSALPAERAMALAQTFAAALDMHLALRGLLTESPYTSTATECECGEFYDSAQGEAAAPSCRHTRAQQALAKAEGR